MCVCVREREREREREKEREREREAAVRKTTGHLTGSCKDTPEPRNPRLVFFQI